MKLIVDHLPLRSLVMGSERLERMQTGTDQWRIPKFHAMLHASSSIILMGPWSNCEAQVVESCHVYMKRLSDLTNQRKGQWKHQVLTHVARGEQAAEQGLHESTGIRADQPTGSQDEAETHLESGELATHVTLSKSNLVAGVRFNIWDYMVDWRMCRHRLLYPAQRQDQRSNTGIYIALQELVTLPSSPGARSEWIRFCTDMKDLPSFLCAYVQAAYHHNLPNVPAPTDDAGSFLSAPEVHQRLLSLVQRHSKDAR